MIQYESVESTVQRATLLSSELCDFISELIYTDPLLATILTKLITGKTKLYELNNINLSQLFCNQVSRLMVNLSSNHNIENWAIEFDKFTYILALSQPHLNNEDVIFVESCKNFYKELLLLENQKYAEDFILSFIHEGGDATFFRMLEEYEENFKLESLQISHSHSWYDLIETAKFIARKFHSDVEGDWLNLLLLCYHHKIHLLQCIVVSVVNIWLTLIF